MANYRLNLEDSLDHFRDQFRFLVSSAESFDSGFEGEAKRLAATIRLLVYDTKRQTSLLSQLELKSAIRYLNTASPIVPTNLATTPGLVVLQVGPSGASYVAPLGNTPNEATAVGFEDWWTRSVTKDEHGEYFSRKDYVCYLANKEGGVHVDPQLDASYAALTRENSLGWVFSANEFDEPLPMGSPALASVRQIAYEVVSCLEAQLAASLNPGRDPTEVEMPRAFMAKIGRNDLCPCRSGLKAKKCHLAQRTSGLHE